MGQSVSFQDDAGLDEDVLIPGAYKTSFIGAPASSAPVDSEAPPFVPIDPTIYLPGKPQEPTPDSGRDNASLTEATCSAELDESTARIDTINIHGGTFNDVGGDYIYTINNFFNPLYADDPWSSAPGPKPPDVQAMKVGKIVEWLSPIINFRATQVEVRERRTPGTGAWLLQGELYNEWKSGVLRVIWGVGMAGAGKTVLA
ncbi:hypothetical protein CC2G_011683 [Coprinopsis cinerea AmutBmut pab1-1]|nr:hypothetical protein CC2G_011683 [Coprinopsis cinerea AmutBmut pab1-1]